MQGLIHKNQFNAPGQFKIDQFIRLIDTRNREYIYVSNIELLQDWFYQKTGKFLNYECGPCLYFYRFSVSDHQLLTNVSIASKNM